MRAVKAIPQSRALAMLLFIEDYHRKYNYAPSIRDIGGACEICTSTTAYSLRSLLSAGLIEMTPQRSRTVRLTPAGLAALAPDTAPPSLAERLEREASDRLAGEAVQ